MGVSERRELRVQDPMVHWRGLPPAIPRPYRSPRARLGVGVWEWRGTPASVRKSGYELKMDTDKWEDTSTINRMQKK